MEVEEGWFSRFPMVDFAGLLYILNNLCQEGLTELYDQYIQRLEGCIENLRHESWGRVPLFLICVGMYSCSELAERFDATLLSVTRDMFDGSSNDSYRAVLKLCKPSASLGELAARYDSVFEDESLEHIFPKKDQDSGSLLVEAFFESAIAVLRRIPTEARFNQMCRLVEEHLSDDECPRFVGGLVEVALFLGKQATEASARQAYFQRAIKYARSSRNVLDFMNIASVLRECALFRSSLDVIDEALSHEIVELKGISPELLHCLLGRITASTLPAINKLQWFYAIAEALPERERIVTPENEGGASAAAAAAAGGAS